MRLLDKKNFDELEQSMQRGELGLFTPTPEAKKIFSTKSFFAWLDTHNPDPRMLSFVKDGKALRYGDRVHPGYFISNVVPPLSHKSIRTALDEGATMQLRSLHNIYQPVRKLQRSLIKSFHCFVSINLYYSPLKTSAFNQHFDPYDFLVLQLSGEKTWKLGKDKKQKVQLKAGQLLYVPAYTYHEVSTQKSDSLHLTIALHRLTLTDLIESLYPQSTFHFPTKKGRFDGPAIQAELTQLSQKISSLKTAELEELILKTWHRKLSQCFYDISLSEGAESVLDEMEVIEGTWVLEQMQRTLIPKSRKK